MESAEDYLKKKSHSKKKSEEIKGCLGIGVVPILRPRKNYYLLAGMGFEADAIEEAYDRTILIKKELIWPYINRYRKLA